jgi:hypothetical protein
MANAISPPYQVILLLYVLTMSAVQWFKNLSPRRKDLILRFRKLTYLLGDNMTNKYFLIFKFILTIYVHV